MFQTIHNFWVQEMPFFQNNQFIYIFLDIVSILTFLRLALIGPIYLFGGRNRL